MEKDNQLQKQLLFLAKFFLVFVVLQTLILALNLNAVERAIASFEAKALGLQSNGNIVFVKGEQFSIDANCTGFLSGAIVAAIVFSLSKPELKKKIAIFVAASAALFALNIPRLYVVLLVARDFGKASAEAVHVITWFSTAAFILALWYFATKKIAKVKDFSELL